MNWDLTSLYASFDDPRWSRDRDELNQDCQAFARLARTLPQAASEREAWLEAAATLGGRISERSTTLYAYAQCQEDTDTQDPQPQRVIDQLDAILLVFREAEAHYRTALLTIDQAVFTALTAKPTWADYAFVLREHRDLAGFQMGPDLEALAADLDRSGASAWQRLHSTLTASAVHETSDGQPATLSQLRAQAHAPERAVRRAAYQRELALLHHQEIALAAALDGVKGTSLRLAERRGWTIQERTLRQNRHSQATLDALLSAMREALPLFQRFLKAKARVLGLPRLSWYDLFAPPPTTSPEPSISFDEAQTIVASAFAGFGPELANFARTAFAERWIDSDLRPNKRGGAYCTDLPAFGQSRILCNFAGSLGDVATLAHELGHAYHSAQLRSAHPLSRDYPMTLAETASIFCETLLFDHLAEAGGLAVLDHWLTDATQVIVDIYSRYLFETAIFQERQDGALGPARYSELMAKAQQAAYGDSLDWSEGHPLMWAVKGHYYDADLAFYNYPYAFGQLFGLGLWSHLNGRGNRREADYQALLRATGSATAENVAALAGIQLEDPAFWRSSLATIETKINQYCTLAGG